MQYIYQIVAFEIIYRYLSLLIPLLGDVMSKMENQCVPTEKKKKASSVCLYSLHRGKQRSVPPCSIYEIVAFEIFHHNDVLLIPLLGAENGKMGNKWVPTEKKKIITM